MPRRAYNDPGHAHFLTFTCYHRHQFLADDRVRQGLAESINNARNMHDFALWAYVFMPEHVHLLILPRRETYSISEILHDIKQPVARRWVSHLRKTAPWRLELMEARQGTREVHRLWQAGGGFDRNLTDHEAIAKTIDYIEFNPVRRKLVKEPPDWMWSSARARAGDNDIPLKIDSLELTVSY